MHSKQLVIVKSLVAWRFDILLLQHVVTEQLCQYKHNSAFCCKVVICSDCSYVLLRLTLVDFVGFCPVFLWFFPQVQKAAGLFHLQYNHVWWFKILLSPIKSSDHLFIITQVSETHANMHRELLMSTVKVDKSASYGLI